MMQRSVETPRVVLGRKVLRDAAHLCSSAGMSWELCVLVKGKLRPMQVRAGLGLLSAAGVMADPLARLGTGQATRGTAPLLSAAVCGLMAFPRPLGACVELGRPATADLLAVVAAAGTGDFGTRLMSFEITNAQAIQ